MKRTRFDLVLRMPKRVLIVLIVLLLATEAVAAGSYSPDVPLPEQFIELEGKQVCYVEAGEGRPVIFVHGLLGNIDYFAPVLEALSESAHVFALDMPGFGKSPGGRYPYTLDFYADTLHEFVKAKGIERPILCGISIGGHVAALYALKYPEELGGLAVIGPSGIGDARSPMAQLRPFLGSEPFFNAFVTRGKIKDLFFRQFERADPAKTQAVYDRREQFHDRKSFEAFRKVYRKTIIDLLKKPLEKRLSAVQAPTLVLWGERDPYHDLKTAAFWQRQISGARLIIGPALGHNVIYEDPTFFIEAIRTFLSGLK